MKFKTGSILKILFISLSLLWGGQSLSAAGPLTVKGVVYDQDNYPLAGASVLIDGTSIGTMADENGEFTISAEKGQVLIVSFIGCPVQNIVEVPRQSPDMASPIFRM